MSRRTDRPVSPEELQRRMEEVSHRMSDAGPRVRVPVWVRTALLGAGLALVAGCRDAEEPPARPGQPVVAPGEGDPAPKPLPPGPQPVAGPMTPVGDLDGERTGMLCEDCGVYGAPPADQDGPPPSMAVASPSTDVDTGGPPDLPPGVGPLRLKATAELPPDAPAELRSLALGFLRQVRFCLTTQDKTRPLAPGELDLRLVFSEGRIQSIQVTGSAAQDPAVKRCLAEANRRAAGADPTKYPPVARAYRTPMDMKLAWTR